MPFQNKSVSMVSGTMARLPRPAAMVGSQYRAKVQMVGKRRRTLGLSTMVRGGLTYGSAVVPSSRGVMVGQPRQWGGGVAAGGGYATAPIQLGPMMPYDSSYPGLSTGYRSTYGGSGSYGSGSSANNPSSQNNLALLAEQYNSNPSSLTPQQWSQLQAAGVIPGTVPYSNSQYVNPSGSSSALSASGAIDPLTGVPYASEVAAAAVPATSSFLGTDPTTGATTILGIDWYWLAGGLALVYMFTMKKGR
jgi:hypothetical protein